jgi:FtsH ternary system domain X6
MPPPTARPKTVSPFEDKLLKITRAIVGQVPVDQALPHIAERSPRPAVVSRAAGELVAESLTKGCVLFLARVGGWRQERFLRNGKPRDGRIWDRTAPAEMPLAFSRHALEWLLWLTANRPDDAQTALTLTDADLTSADRLLVFLTYHALRDSEFTAALRARPAIASHGLIRLAFPEDFSAVKAEPLMAAWLDGLGATILEALEPWLVDRWIQIEQHKREIGDWPALAALGREEERLLTLFAAAAEDGGRPDLIRWQLRVAAAVLPPDVSKDMFSGGLQGTGPARLGERLDVLRLALAVPRHLLRLRDWERRARTIGYLDEGYSAAQAWLADWERLGGDALAERAEALVGEVEPLKVSQGN